MNYLTASMEYKREAASTWPTAQLMKTLSRVWR